MVKKPVHIDKIKEDDVFEQLRGYFGSSNLLVGGSYAYSKALDLEWNRKDIDIFFLMPRIETWALVNILNLIFDDVFRFDTDFYQDHFMKNKDEYYKIEGQWKRIIAWKDGIMYDLIFVDNTKLDLILNDTGSTISKLYYDIDYGIKILRLNSTSEDVKGMMLKSKECDIYYDKCTDAYASKIENLCNKLGLKINGR